MHCYGNLEEQKSETNTSFSLDCLLTSRDIGLQLSGIPLVRKGFDIITSGSDNKKFETCPLCTNNQFIALAFSSCIPLRAQFCIFGAMVSDDYLIRTFLVYFTIFSAWLRINRKTMEVNTVVLHFRATTFNDCKNFLLSKVCWQHPAMFCLDTSNKLSRQ